MGTDWGHYENVPKTRIPSPYGTHSGQAEQKRSGSNPNKAQFTQPLSVPSRHRKGSVSPSTRRDNRTRFSPENPALVAMSNTPPFRRLLRRTGDVPTLRQKSATLKI